MSVREFGDHDGSSPRTRMVGAALPSAGMTQMSNSPACIVKAIHLPSGDQSGSVGFGVPEVRITCTSPPPAGTLASTRRSRILVAKQIHCPSGDQQGDESSLVEVSFRGWEPSALATHTLGLPLWLITIASREPSGETAGLILEPV